MDKNSFCGVDSMSEQNDHDLLIALNTKMEMMLTQQSNFMSQITDQTGALRDRVTALENKDSRDSEKVQAIRSDVQRSLDNATKVDALRTEVTALTTRLDDQTDEINRLRSKANLWDAINSAGIVLTGLLGYLLGK